MKRKITASLLLSFCALHFLSAQEKVSNLDSTKELTEIIVSGNKFAEKKKNIVQKIDIISAGYINKANTQNIGDLLMNTGNIFVQKSQQGGSSPVIRGFEASRILLIVDGVRMNNAIYRSGHLQNAITVDQNMLGSVEVLQGPSSTLYGSDALGGAIHMLTKKPILSHKTGKTSVNSNAFARYSSANNEKTIHADVNIGLAKFGILTSVTQSDFGDVTIGENDKSGFAGFGTRPFYIQPYDGVHGDTIMQNKNDRVQRFSGYSQIDLMQKVLFKASDNITHELNLQYSTTSNVPRYDRLQDITNGALRYASWYYGPQDRSLFAYTLSAKNKRGFFSEYNATLNYQGIEESRITREYKKYDRFDKRVEKVGVTGLVIDARKKWQHDEITSGIDIQLNNVKSVASRTNLLNQSVTKLDTRYPDGKNNMNYAAVYTEHIHKFKNSKWILNDGVRVQYISLRSTIEDNSFLSLPVTHVVQNNTSLTGNIGLAYQPTSSTRISISYSSGFRAPNIDDLSKIFESSTLAQQVVVPNSNLKPEYTNSLDLGLKHTIASKVEFEIGLFYTNFSNAIIKAPYTLNGQDSILYNNVKSQVLASQNANNAYLYGGNLSTYIHFDEHWKFSGSVNLTKGRFLTDVNSKSTIYQKQEDGSYSLAKANVSSKPLDHIPPIFGKLSLGYERKKRYAELYMLYNGWKTLNHYNADGEDNAQDATAKGSPSWQTLNIKAGASVGEKLTIQVGIENILDINYRYFASGFSAPGRSFIISLRAHF